ncbi:hypothetical protein NRB56_35000 [Nocardia sp. RB56]|uniref:Uncharacterized protein n=1 Tax=Nocardia aurantia TaxID=2585199 RepID=A0A7K0DQW1_9NOCA|nr:hypothetical protein [Nocardia aurantia]
MVTAQPSPEEFDYRNAMTFVWLVVDGSLEAAFVIDGTDWHTSAEAKAGRDAVLAETENLLAVGNWETTYRRADEIARWPNWRDVRSDVRAGTFRLGAPRRSRPQPPGPGESTPATPPPAGALRFAEHHGQLVMAFPPGQGPVDPISTRRASGYGLNITTGEFEPDTRWAFEFANGADDDETWPLDADEFARSVEEHRMRYLSGNPTARLDHPEIFALYDTAAKTGLTEEIWRTTSRLWDQAHRRRAHYLADGEPVRVTWSDEGRAGMAYRVDHETGRLVATTEQDAQHVIASKARRVTEQSFREAVEAIRTRRQDETSGIETVPSYPTIAVTPVNLTEAQRIADQYLPADHHGHRNRVLEFDTCFIVVAVPETMASDTESAVHAVELSSGLCVIDRDTAGLSFWPGHAVAAVAEEYAAAKAAGRVVLEPEWPTEDEN